jgi:hypothetical protein
MSSYEELEAVIKVLRKENEELRKNENRFQFDYYTLKRKCIAQHISYNILYKKCMGNADDFYPGCDFDEYLKMFNEFTLKKQIFMLGDMRKLDHDFTVGYIHFGNDYEMEDFVGKKPSGNI